MKSRLSRLQHAELQFLAGTHTRVGMRPRRQGMERLKNLGLITEHGSVTLLGMIALHLDGRLPDARIQRLLIALADADVERSNSYRLTGARVRAPAAVLDRFVDAGFATQRWQRGAILCRATGLCCELAVRLRQQTLPPPVGA